MNFTNNNAIIQKIKNRMNKKPILIIGEIHGALENIDIIDSLRKELDVKVVFIELESKWDKYFKHSNKKGFDKEMRGKLFSSRESWLIESGLIGEESFAFWKLLTQEGCRIVCAKIDHRDWNIAEQLTADNILKIVKKIEKNPNKERFIIVFGKLHARKNKFSINYENKILNLKPIGYLLREYSTSLQIRYGSGEIYNFGNKKVNDKKAIKLLGKRNIILRKNSGEYFDYDLIVRKSRPVKPLSK